MTCDSPAEQGRLKARVARLSVLSNALLTALKLTAGIVIGSIAVIAEALHSAIDLLAAALAWWSVRKAAQPADASHPFGHGKFESLSAVIEGGLIFVAAAAIIWAAVGRLAGGAEVTMPLVGLAVMAVSAAVNTGVSTLLFRVARRTESPALEADAWHLRTDVYTSLGVLAGMAGIYLARRAGLPDGRLIDPLAAIVLALVISRAAWDIARRSLAHLTDGMLPTQEQGLIERLISEHYPQFVNYHRVRSRRAGSERHIDLHLVLPSDTHVADAHALCDHLEEDIRRALPNVHILIHVEPEEHHD